MTTGTLQFYQTIIGRLVTFMQWVESGNEYIAACGRGLFFFLLCHVIVHLVCGKLLLGTGSVTQFCIVSSTLPGIKSVCTFNYYLLWSYIVC